MNVSGSATSSERRCAAIFNPTKPGVGAMKKAITASAHAAGWPEPMWLETTPDDAGQQCASRAAQDGVDLVIAAGGDGTVRAVAEGLRESGIPLAIMPVGTGNILARNLSLPYSNMEHTAAIAFSGDERTIDVGVAELTRADGSTHTHAFVVMAGLGIDAKMIAGTNAILKDRVGWLAYVESGLRTLTRAKRMRIRYTVGDQNEHSAQVSTILVGNCGALPGNIELMPDAELDDGELDIAVLQPRSIFGWLLIWRKVTWENRVLRRSAFGRRMIRYSGSETSSMLTYLRGPGVRISVDEPQPVELDGDELGDVTEVNLWADPGALIVKVASAPTPRRR